MFCGLRESRLPLLRLRLERPRLFVVGPRDQQTRLQEQRPQFILPLLQLAHQPCSSRFLDWLLRLGLGLGLVALLVGVILFVRPVAAQILERRVHLAQEFEHRVFRVGHGLDRGVVLANGPL